MGVDITTYHSRIGTSKHTCGQDVVTITCFIGFSAGLKTIGSVVFIGLLLLIAGIESNPGPNEIKRIILTIAILLCACVYVQRLDYVLYTVFILIVVNIYCGGIVNGIDPDISHEGPQKQFNQLNEEIEQIEDDKSVEDENELGSESFGDFGILSKGTRTDADHEHMIGADVSENATPPKHDNEGESESGTEEVEIPIGKDIPRPASTSELGPSISNNNGTRTDADHEHMIGADVSENTIPSKQDNEGESESGSEKVEIPIGKDIPRPASTSELGPSISNNKDISETSRNGENGAAAFKTGREETATREECLGSEGDITELDKGSEEIVTNASKPMSEEERKSTTLLWNDKEFLQSLKDKTFAGVVDQKMAKWEQEYVHVGVLGRVGTGKSRFINAFRCCSTEEDPLYAPVGSIETTKEAKAYPHPKNPRLILWDLPGIGTDTFPREEYVKHEKTAFGDYHIYVVMASDRFTQDDIYLAKEIEKTGKVFLFVRTRVDINLEIVPDRKIEDEVKKIRDDCSESLSKGKFKSNEVYLISSRFVNHKNLDFGQLLERLVGSLEGLKKTVMLYSLQFNTKLFIDGKEDELISRIKYVSAISAVGGGLPIPGCSIVVDYCLITHELDFYRETLGVTEGDLENLADKTKKNVDYLTTKYKLKTFDIFKEVTKFGAQYGPILRRISASEAVESTSKLCIPVFGSAVAAGVSFGTTYHLLKSYLDMMVKDARKMLEILLEETGSTVMPLNRK